MAETNTITVNVDEKIEKKFRTVVAMKYGTKKGIMVQAVGAVDFPLVVLGAEDLVGAVLAEAVVEAEEPAADFKIGGNHEGIFGRISDCRCNSSRWFCVDL